MNGILDKIFGSKEKAPSISDVTKEIQSDIENQVSNLEVATSEGSIVTDDIPPSIVHTPVVEGENNISVETTPVVIPEGVIPHTIGATPVHHDIYDGTIDYGEVVKLEQPLSDSDIKFDNFKYEIETAVNNFQTLDLESVNFKNTLLEIIDKYNG